MSIDKKIKNFTATDIEKYHKGLLSSKEMHDLEKAALDDPFLADALEGYAVGGVNAKADIDELKIRLAGKVESEKVIPITGGGKSFPWLRVAVLVVVIAGAGLLARQFIFNGGAKNIAQADTKKTAALPMNDTIGTSSIPLKTDTVKTKSTSTTVQLNPNTQSYSFTTEENKPQKNVSTAPGGNGTVTTGKEADNVTVMNTPNVQPPVTVPEKVADERNDQYKTTIGNAEKREFGKDEQKNKTASLSKKEYDKDTINDQFAQNGESLKNNKSVTATNRQQGNEGYSRNNTINVFRGRVTDASNVGVPFANVTNAQDNNAGTYTDAKGNFNLTYPDTVLTVQVRSIGFENTNVQLRNSVTNNQVIMQDDRKSLSEVVINKKKPNATVRSRDDNNVKLEEPEPADGWDNYDAYLANNLNQPDEIKSKPNAGGDVQVSFEVDKNGEPINIKVEKSLCSKCDSEAIRLIKEGPKWKRNAKKGRTTVTVSF